MLYVKELDRGGQVCASCMGAVADWLKASMRDMAVQAPNMPLGSKKGFGTWIYGLWPCLGHRFVASGPDRSQSCGAK